MSIFESAITLCINNNHNKFLVVDYVYVNILIVKVVLQSLGYIALLWP